jgi:ABC-type multidrug transport system fused ATPase/permease subunit
VPAMMKWNSVGVVTVAFALFSGTPAWAQEAAKPDAASGCALLTLMFFLPLPILLFFMFSLMRKQQRYSTQANRSLELSEESIKLAKEQVVVQKETNELLRQLIAKQSRF